MARAMKPSGNEWIGEIPAEWEIKPLKRMFQKRDSGAWGIEPQNNEYDFICIRVADFDFNNLTVKKSDEYTLRNYEINTINKLVLKQGDILLEKSGGGELTHVGRVIGFNLPINALYANFIDRLRPDTSVCSKYILYLLASYYHYGISGKYIKQTTGIQNLDITSFLTEKAILPSLPEQYAISDFLDAKCELIDSTIEKQKAVIEKLKLYKQSIITEAVTKGLDSTVKMKPSGIEWIGMIPEHWQLLSFKQILNERIEKNIPIQTDERLSLSIDKGVTLYSEKTTNLDRFKDDVSLYKLAHVGDFVLNSMNMIVGAVGVSNYFGCVSPAYYTYYDNEVNHITAKFCDYLFKSKTIKKVLYSLGKGIMAIDRGDDKINTCRLKVSRDDLRSLKLPLPNVSEQNQIVAFLDRKCSGIDGAINVKQTVIDKVTEYKKSLIYEYITGKKEVV